MKKIFTLIVMCVLAISAQAKITIYVQCETAPFLWTWGAVGGTFSNIGDWPGELQMTEKITHPDSGEIFWAYSFPDEITQISFLFNNGESSGTKQTGNFEDVTTDRYFVLAWDDGDGNVSCVDITEDYIEIPDAEVTSMGVSGNHADWNTPSTIECEVVEAGKTFKYTVNPSQLVIDGITWMFKFRPNMSSWLGYWNIYYWDQPDAETGLVPEPVEGKTAMSEAPEWLAAGDDGNFSIDLDQYKADSFTFTLTWGGGKVATDNWTLTAEAQNLITGIKNVKTTKASDAAIYNLQGQRVDGNFRGIAIQNGKKMLMK